MNAASFSRRPGPNPRREAADAFNRNHPECPLRCPGCYAYENQHLGGGVTLRQLNDLQGHIRIAVSVGGLREDHDRRRAPATYDRPAVD